MSNVYPDNAKKECHKTNFEKVKEFHKVFGLPRNNEPKFPDAATIKLRMKLIHEEYEEFLEGLLDRDIVEVADALTDILYVVYGTGDAFGIDLDACFKEVQRSNMSKLGQDGKPMVNDYGKIIKGPLYSKPDLKSVLFPNEISKLMYKETGDNIKE